MLSKFLLLLTLFIGLVGQFTIAQEKTITGTVTDQDDLPFPGVNVVVKNTNNGTQTNFDGKYFINAQVGVFSFPYASHIIFYGIFRNHIPIARVLHGSRDLRKF